MTRTTGSVPEGRSNSRPLPSNAASTSRHTAPTGVSVCSPHPDGGVGTFVNGQPGGGMRVKQQEQTLVNGIFSEFTGEQLSDIDEFHGAICFYYD